MRDRIDRHAVSFKHAFRGLFYAFGSQPNFLIHFLAALAVLALGYYLRMSKTDFIILIFLIVMVFVCELINTALESITDLVTSEWRVEAKIAKDVSAGMVLFVSLAAVVIGIILFGGYL